MTSQNGKFHGSHTMIDVEKVCYGQNYTFNYNPEDSRQYWNQDDRVMKFYKYHKQFVFGNLNCYFLLRMEISKLGRLHYHGIIRWDNKEILYKFLVENVHQLTLNGTFEIDTIADPKEWDRYMSKQTMIPIEYLILAKGVPINTKYKPSDGFKTILPKKLGSVKLKGPAIRPDIIPKDLPPNLPLDNDFYEST